MTIGPLVIWLFSGNKGADQLLQVADLAFVFAHAESMFYRGAAQIKKIVIAFRMF